MSFKLLAAGALYTNIAFGVSLESVNNSSLLAEVENRTLEKPTLDESIEWPFPSIPSGPEHYIKLSALL